MNFTVFSYVVTLADGLILAFVPTDGMVVAICGVVIALGTNIFGLIMFLLRSSEDRKNRELDLEERKALRDMTSTGFERVVIKGEEREQRIVGHVEEAKSLAATAYKEANNLNLKLESIGIQTKPTPE